MIPQASCFTNSPNQISSLPGLFTSWLYLRCQNGNWQAALTCQRQMNALCSCLVWLQQDGEWRVAVGTQLNCSGTALLYSTSDFKNYTYDGVLASQIGISPDGICADDGTGAASTCNQFGQGCRMWECVDAIQVGPVMAIKWSDQVRHSSASHSGHSTWAKNKGDCTDHSWSSTCSTCSPDKVDVLDRSKAGPRRRKGTIKVRGGRGVELRQG